MRVLDKHVELNENFGPVLLITIELPLSLGGDGFRVTNREFMESLIKAIKEYEDRERLKEEKKDGE
jgi:hypothetical protein